MRHIKYILIFITGLSLASCGTVGDYYITDEGGEERSHSTLLKDKNIFVHLDHFDGNSSVLTVYQRDTTNSVSFKIIRIEQTLSSGNIQIPSKTIDNTKRILSANPDSSVLVNRIEVYETVKTFERVTEKIDIEILVNDKLVIISKVFYLKRVTYNQLQAIWAI